MSRELSHQGYQVTSAQTRDLGSGPDEAWPSPLPPGPAPNGLMPAGSEQPAGRHRQVILNSGVESAKAARDFTAATLQDWQLGALAEDAVIIASELVTNAIRHGTCVIAGEAEHSLVMLAWQQHADRLTCMVIDRNTGPPVLTPASPDAQCGRGLRVVQALAAEWGWMMLGAHQKAVWAALCLPVTT